MKLSNKILVGSGLALVLLGGVCAADPGGIVSDLTRSALQTQQATTPSEDPSPTPSDTSEQPSTSSDSSPFVATEETVNPSTVSSAPVAVRPTPKTAIGTCRRYADGSEYQCEQPAQQAATASPEQPYVPQNPELTDEQRQGLTVTNTNDLTPEQQSYYQGSLETPDGTQK